MIALCRGGPLDNQFVNVRAADNKFSFPIPEEKADAIYVMAGQVYTAQRYEQAVIDFSTWKDWEYSEATGGYTGHEQQTKESTKAKEE